MSWLRINFRNDDSVETGHCLELYKEFADQAAMRLEILWILREVVVGEATHDAAMQALTAIKLVKYGYEPCVPRSGHDGLPEVAADLAFIGEPRGEGCKVEISLDGGLGRMRSADRVHDYMDWDSGIFVKAIEYMEQNG